MNRETREIVASACGDRSENTCQILWDRVLSAYKEAIFFGDYWSAYQTVIPSEQQHPVGKETGETAHIERWNNTLLPICKNLCNLRIKEVTSRRLTTPS